MPNANAPATDAPATTTNKTDEPAKPGGELGKDAFLKLLVAQLKYQDPSHPMDNTEFLAQTAQFTTVEKLTDMATVEQNLLAAQLQLGASNLIGRTVTYTGKDGKEQTGVVTAAKFAGTTTTVRVGDADVALADIKQVTATDAAAPPASDKPAQPATQQAPPAQQTPDTQQAPPAQQTPDTQQTPQTSQPAAQQTPPTQQTPQTPTQQAPQTPPATPAQPPTQAS
ncbi:flagellar hook capping FlgD N-terminal domain-containing protein [Dactylosporangium salmoneum]|uniref:Basal-body rod modification protein FlgD n=1 Tax=Dactylosporangium salmoneum TaxID=53361 RepID=A0ABP5TMP0_9ACTN